MIKISIMNNTLTSPEITDQGKDFLNLKFTFT